MSNHPMRDFRDALAALRSGDGQYTDTVHFEFLDRAKPRPVERGNLRLILALAGALLAGLVIGAVATKAMANVAAVMVEAGE